MYIPRMITGSAQTVHPVQNQIEHAQKIRFELLERLRKKCKISANRANAVVHYDAKTDDEKRYRIQALPIIAKFQQMENALNARLNEIRHQPPATDIHPDLKSFYDTLPLKPYASEFKSEMSIKTKQYAWNKEYIQPNHPAVAEWLVFDIDNSNGLYAHHDANAPAPQMIVINPENGHAHLFYKLKTGVGKWGKSSAKAVMYLTAVYSALARKLGADAGYSGNICKNPNSLAWQTYIPNDAPDAYDLGDLASWLDLPSWNETAKIKNRGYDETTAVGRNVSLFHGIRHRCYDLAGQMSSKALYIAIVALADAYNDTFETPLSSNEVMHTVRSIYRYCISPRFREAKAQSDARFSALQAKRGAKGGAVSKRGASATSARTQQPWVALGISRKTYYKRKKNNTLGG